MTPAALYTVEDLMEIFGVSKTTLYARKKTDGWPHLLFGAKVRFSQQHLDTILTMYERQPETTQRRPRIGTRSRSKR